MVVPSGYKAIVCVNLNGGMDGYNLLVPTDTTTYNKYQSGRGFYATPRANLLPLAGTNFGLNPGMTNLRRMYAAGNAAMIANVGTLIKPTNRADWQTGSSTLIPVQLLSHSDQAMQWFNGRPDLSSGIERSGLMGRVADFIKSLNGVLPHTMQITITPDANNILPGKSTDYVTIGVNGAAILAGFGRGNAAEQAKYTAFQTILNTSRVNYFDTTYTQLFKENLGQSDYVKGTLDLSTNFTFPDTDIGRQLKMVAKLISAADTSKFNRQCFYVSQRQYDFHNDGPAVLTATLTELDAAIGAFYDAMASLNALNKIIAFTTSEFGRTFKPNSSGTDHGWGSNHFAFGAVRAGVYGTYPDLVLGGNQDAGDEGRWIPTTSVDQYFAPIAKWMGVTDAQLPEVVSLLKNFPLGALNFAL